MTLTRMQQIGALIFITLLLAIAFYRWLSLPQ
jgi:hypothetical protein